MEALVGAHMMLVHGFGVLAQAVKRRAAPPILCVVGDLQSSYQYVLSHAKAVDCLITQASGRAANQTFDVVVSFPLVCQAEKNSAVQPIKAAQKRVQIP